MFQHLKCGACGSSRLLRIPTTPGDHSHITTGARLLHTIGIDKYVCTECGKVEEWVGSAVDLRLLSADLDRAPDNG